ncbi:MAG: hypothetical protein LBP78_06720 [Acidaminococcales bacterium]|jgi:hypothetical protein|nr:hypothetical protein [Acidaminococcales bacterium]
MVYEVREAFIDAETRKPYNRGKKFETADIARAEKLIAGGYLFPIRQTAEAPAAEAAEAAEAPAAAKAKKGQGSGK